MVLVRKRFFRTHCENLLKSNNLGRSRTLTKVFTKNYTSQTNAKDKEGYGGKKKTSGSGYGKEKAGMIISGPFDGGFVPGIEDRELRRVESPNEIVEAGNGSSSGGSENQGTTAISSAFVLDRDVDASPNDVNGNTSGRDDLDIEKYRTITINEPYRDRQKIRAMSLRPTLTQDTSMNQINTPNFTPIVSHIPTPFQPKHSGFGGFPTPLQLLPSFLPKSTKLNLRKRVSRVEPKATILTNPRVATEDMRGVEGDDWGEAVRARIAQWMPENLGGLVIGRNSRFYTEELGDEELETLGGVEYRALRLLSHLVTAVCFPFHVPVSLFITLIEAEI